MDKPKRLHPNSKCDGYIKDLASFVLPPIGGPDTVSDCEARLRVFVNCRELLANHTEKAIRMLLFRSLKRDIPKRLPKDKVLQLIACAGADALSLRFVRDEIRRKEANAMGGNLDERREGASWLKELGKLLVGDNRGKRAKAITASKDRVKMFYYEQLFRLYHIEHALRSLPGSRTMKVTGASRFFEMPEKLIRELWNLEPDSEHSRPDSLKEMARRLTARQFQISRHRVANILSSPATDKARLP